jgi:hypothetical protein
MIKPIFLIPLLLLAITNATAQKSKTAIVKTNTVVTECDALKKENDSLKKALGLNEPINSLVRNDIEYKFIRVVGDKKSQTVSVEIIVTNKIENRNFEMMNMMGTSIKIITVTGDVLFSNEVFVPGASQYSMSTILHTDVPLKMTFNFNPLLPSNEYIKLFYLSYKLRNLQDSKKDTTEEIEFNDLKINWK